MIKKLIKISSIILLFVILIVFYLSLVGVKTEKFNEKIIDKISTKNKRISLNIKDIKFLLDPFNFTINVVTKNPEVLIDGNKLKINEIKTDISLKPLIFKEFSLDDLQISTKYIKLEDLILLARSFTNSTQLFLLDRLIKDGSLIADINLEFDEQGKIKKNYQVTGYIKDVKLNFLNKVKVNDLNLEFEIKQNKYSLIKVKAVVNKIKLSSPLFKINQKEDQFLIKGKIITDKQEFNGDEISMMNNIFLNNLNIEKVRFKSENNIYLNISKKLKIKDLDVQSKINLNQLVIRNNLIGLKSYIPNLEEVIDFQKHKITINYNKKKTDIKGSGKILIKDRFDIISYEAIKKNHKLTFNTKTNFKNNKLLINFLNYEKKENLDALIEIRGNFKKDNLINFDLISLIEKNNKISIKNLHLSKDFKLISVDSFNFNYLNDKKIQNQLLIKKRNLNYSIKGKSFDATKLINKIMDSDDANSILFDDFNSKINIKIDKTYIDEVNFVNNLSGILIFKNNQIDDLNLKSFFPDDKKFNLLIKTNDKQEKITKLFTDYPKPLIKRYNFIKGFEDGFLVYHSVKKDGISNSILTIENFKVKEIPVFAKLLSLASLQGIADLLTGEGIRFTDLEMKFSSKKKLTNIDEFFVIGPAVSILMDGYIDSNNLISLRGTLVPATTINKTIASIPLLGNILVGKRTGEGIFGVSFKIKGSPKKLKTIVNPIKTLTPRFITRALEKIKSN
tara:strand:+ start:428 stop:2626 length:2199 start_codon:yes stop_codon:yes gene_type:complete